MEAKERRFVQFLLVVLCSLSLTACSVGLGREGRSPYSEYPPQIGVASFYHCSLHGRRTASGERYDRSALTAAHRDMPFGTVVRVTNLENGRSLILRINDRGPFVRGRIIDVSRHAAQRLGFERDGITKVSVEVVEIPVSA